MAEIIQHEDEYYILATSSLADDRIHVLKDGDSFAIFNRSGDILPVGMHEEGVYDYGTRFLSRYELKFSRNFRPILLSSSMKDDNLLLTVDMTNPDYKSGDHEIYHGTIHILRSIFLSKHICYERIRFWNLGLEPIKTNFSLRVDSDFSDIFEVRGLKRAKKGKPLEDQTDKAGLVMSYLGLDQIIRNTWIRAYPEPSKIDNREFFFDIDLKPKDKVNFFISISCGVEDKRPKLFSYEEAFDRADLTHGRAKQYYCGVHTSNEGFNGWINQSMADFQMMVTQTKKGLYPYAGVPWFSTVFGRDGIISAFETLWINPEIARGVLLYLALTQAKKLIPEQDAAPGKIIHEVREGEMANLNEIPFGRYYGSVDSTPLFLMLAGAYYERTGDIKLIRVLWPHIEQAVEWMNRYGDSDGDGFIDYSKMNPKGLTQQGWKDSEDSIFHADGSIAEGPNALCEVQAYAYGAKKEVAKLAALMGKNELAANMLKESAELKKRFNETFWIDKLGIYGIALDGQKKLCAVRTSNAGQCLWTGIVDEDKAERLANTLTREDFFSGWGIRTVSSFELRYNPMAYHNGSVWPHDNALIAYGLARYGFKNHVVKILTGLFNASLFLELSRLPELYCGFEKRDGEGPTLYPVACSPQSWASGAVFLLLQACLGLSINGAERTVYFNFPVLPPFLQRVTVQDLKVSDHSVSISIERQARDVAINVIRRTGNIKVVTVK